MAEFSVRYDEVQNRVYVYLEGSLTEEEALKLKEDYGNTLAKCRPGFTELINVSNFKPGPQEVQNVMGEMAIIAARAGVGKVARVVGETPLGGMQIDRLARTEGKYRAAHFETVEEAEAFLDSEDD